MDNKKVNIQRYYRRKNIYRVILGIQQLIFHPILNFIWIIYVTGIVFLVKGVNLIVEKIETYPILKTTFSTCMNVILILFPIICLIGIMQFIGFVFAIKDEADIDIVFSDKCYGKSQPPILIYKKKCKKSGVIKREFYTVIPMERWQEKKDSICDRMNIHLVSDITYGGKKKNKGYCIYFESAKGRKAKERGALYDDTF